MGDRMGYQPNRAGMVSENGVGILIQTDAKDMGFGYGFDFDQRRYSPILRIPCHPATLSTAIRPGRAERSNVGKRTLR